MSEIKSGTSILKTLLIPCATVFISSFCVMVIELVAGRIIARYLGSSLYTWTSIIGVVLAGITIGNYVGGRLADRFRTDKVLTIMFAACAGACLVIIGLNTLIGNWTWLWQLNWPTRILLHVTVVFLFPAAFLGTISPVVAKMALEKGLPTGRTVGDIYAWGAGGQHRGHLRNRLLFYRNDGNHLNYLLRSGGYGCDGDAVWCGLVREQGKSRLIILPKTERPGAHYGRLSVSCGSIITLPSRDI